MTFSVSHWSGRLGNNIQQVANCIMAAKKYENVFQQKLDHDIISKFKVSFSGVLSNIYCNGNGLSLFSFIYKITAALSFSFFNPA